MNERDAKAMNEVYEGSKKKALAELEALKQRILNHGKDGQVHYGHVGDMSHVACKLDELLNNK